MHVSLSAPCWWEGRMAEPAPVRQPLLHDTKRAPRELQGAVIEAHR